MANHAARKQQSPLEDATPQRVSHEYDVPEELWGEAKTADFGDVRTIGLKLLTPLEEKSGIQRSKGDALLMAFELAKVALAFVIDEEGREKQITTYDGSSDLLFAQVGAKIRTLIVQAYSEMASPSESATASFIKSRRIRA